MQTNVFEKKFDSSFPQAAGHKNSPRTMRGSPEAVNT